MTDGTNISRRKLLGSMATVGGAAALGGAGSVAFFNDREEFANNQLVAGSLDLKVDWQEYYSDWSDDESAAVDDGEIIMAPQDTTLQEGDYPDDYTGLPTPNNALVAIPDEDVVDFLAASATEAYPDADDDGMVDSAADLEELGYDVCIHGADTPEDLDPTVDPESLDPEVDDSFKTEGTGLRTNNDDTVTEDGEVKPLISLDDVKPGDFGEVTISFHLCDNDAYVALTGEQRTDADNTQTEPERKDPDETDGLESGELDDQIRVSLWMDGVDENDRGIDDEPTDSDGNNQVDDGEMVLVEEASLSAALDVIGASDLSLTPAGGGGGTASFACEEDVITISEPGSSGIQAGQTGSTMGASGETTIEIDRTQDDDGDGDVESFSFTLTGPEELAVGDYPGVCALSINTADGGTIEVDYGSGGCVRDSILLPPPDEPQVESRITSVDFDLCTLVAAEEEECFTASDTYYIGFAWWLPIDHGNEVQTDSVAFDLGFYAEQCRHNDGIGNVPET